MRPLHRRLSPDQRGVALIVSLVLLVIVTLLAIGSLRGVLLQTRMSGTTTDRSLAFQAAEAALRDAERSAATPGGPTFPSSGCGAGNCVMPVATAAPRWLDDSFTGWRTSAAQAPTAAPTPQVVVEDMGDAPNWAGCDNEIPRQPNCSTRRYRVSARSTADGRASVVLQSQVAAP